MDGADRQLVVAAFEAVRRKFLERGAAPTAPLRPPELWLEVSAFETALLTGNQREALAVLNRCMDSGQSLVEVELHVCRPSLYRNR